MNNNNHTTGGGDISKVINSYHSRSKSSDDSTSISYSFIYSNKTSIGHHEASDQNKLFLLSNNYKSNHLKDCNLNTSYLNPITVDVVIQHRKNIQGKLKREFPDEGVGPRKLNRRKRITPTYLGPLRVNDNKGNC